VGGQYQEPIAEAPFQEREPASWRDSDNATTWSLILNAIGLIALFYIVALIVFAIFS
jgi:hypothetical protein